ncbi:MAG: hypothetical protein ABSH20_10500 [Tepidisphaeraceae bacterium]|jgi:hypothetical protein
MRIPLTRSAGDETPIAWWEYLFAPIIMPLFLLFLLFAAVVSIPLEFVNRLRQNRQERQLGRRLAAVNRLMRWDDVAAKLIAGEGTLIIEHRSPSGPIREWWTEDDLIGSAPVLLPDSLTLPPTEEQLRLVQEYGKACSERYVSIESGTAKLTQVPVPLNQQLDPRKYVSVQLGAGTISWAILAIGRKLAEQYPRGKVVTLLAWSDAPILFLGDAESVFCPDDTSGDPGSRDRTTPG